MDLQKTGALIAQRRRDLSLTQKELAQKLHISDRTVSKWERGVGFPDLTLLEPLADTLGLSVLELMHGEPAPEPQPEAEHTARETVRSLGPVIAQRMKKVRDRLRALSGLLILAAAVYGVLFFLSGRHFLVSSKELSAASAVRQCPFILITTEDYALRDKLLSDAAIAGLRNDGAVTTVDDTLAAPYRDMVRLNASIPDSFGIVVAHRIIYVTATHGKYSCIYTFSENGAVRKCCSDSRYVLENENNEAFFTTDSKRDLLGIFRSP